MRCDQNFAPRSGAGMSRRAFVAGSGALMTVGCVTMPTDGRSGAWAKSIGAFEHGDSGRSGLFDGFNPFASSSASQARVERLDGMPGLWNVAFTPRDLGFALHGVLGVADGSIGPTVSVIDALTMRELGRTSLPMPDGDRRWIYPGGVAVHANGFVYAAYATRIAKLDPVSGALLAVRDLPQPNGPDGTAYNGFIALPDGMLLLKSHHRKIACRSQGYRALVECGVDGLPPSALVLLDPSDLHVVWSGVAPELIGGRVSSVRFSGIDYVYLAGARDVHRMVYRDRRLLADPQWGPVPYRGTDGQPGTAVVPLGAHVVVLNNALPSRSPLSLTTISQRNSRKTYSVAPFADQGGAFSFMPSKPSVDAVNRRIYVGDAHGGLAALSIDADGGVRRDWVRAYRTGSFISILGPSQRRVLAVSDIGAPTYDDLGVPMHAAETCRWIDARSGESLADIPNLPRNFGLTLTPGPASAIYYATRAQGLFKLTPKAALKSESPGPT